MSRQVQPEELHNSFGKLVQAYRKQRGWTQDEVAARWGHTREYVSQIERGQRKLDRSDQVIRLAEILEIPAERLEAIGRGIPKLPARTIDLEVDLQEADNFLLQTILAQAQTTIKLSWLVWHADNDASIENNLSNLINTLENAVQNRRGALLKPALQLLAYAHEMMGKIAFDKLDYTKAGGHFHEMNELGDELNEPDIIALSMIHQGDLLRRRGRYDLAIRCLQAAVKFADASSSFTSGLLWQTMARTFAEYGHPKEFLAAIDKAQNIATQIEPSMDTTINQFNLVDVMQERAQGYTLLWEPQKAIEIYDESEKLKPYRPMRDLGVLVILKAQAYAYNGDVDQGVKFALRGLQLARGYQSERHVSRVQRMYDRLSVTKLGQAAGMRDLKDALRTK